ncbi:hypothetical protein DPX16_17104 [Anabarilius grahami]|uniref:Uncharacterized protein n=1 Tax=Anabarilius grahami TaxID=495550 RepID=A0A3N0YAM5_ANAGA|nr:hypothetical protein DPX16_17104 [Anabarilius grahami]
MRLDAASTVPTKGNQFPRSLIHTYFIQDGVLLIKRLAYLLTWNTDRSHKLHNAVVTLTLNAALRMHRKFVQNMYDANLELCYGTAQNASTTRESSSRTVILLAVSCVKLLLDELLSFPPNSRITASSDLPDISRDCSLWSEVSPTGIHRLCSCLSSFAISIMPVGSTQL